MLVKAAATTRRASGFICMGLVSAIIAACGGAPDDTSRGEEAASAAPPPRRPVQCTDVRVEQLAGRPIPLDLQNQVGTAVEQAFGEPLLARDNEVHDCQRLVGAGNPPPLVALWAFKNLGTTDYSQLLPVIGIGAQEGTYPDLGIQGEKSCLFVKGDTGDQTGGTWEAYVVTLTSDRCSGMTVQNGKKLNVYRTNNTEPMTGKPFPIAVRWEDANNKYFIAFQCAAKWCVVGVPTAGEKPPGWNSPANAWGDVQNLAMMENGSWRRTGLRAKIRPMPNIDQHEYDENVWYNVARIVITGTDATAEQHYLDKFNLKVTSLPGSLSVAVMRTGNNWQMQFGNSAQSNGPVDAWFVGGEMVVRGTARWRWSESDESVWVQCSSGCCGSGPPPARPPGPAGPTR